MRLVAGVALLMLSACSEPDEKSEAGEPLALPTLMQATAPPRSEGEALLSRYTWPGLDGEETSGPYAPRDDCGEVDGAYEFRIALADAVLARDTDTLVGMASPDIKLDFGGGEGRDELRRRLSEPGWELWSELEEVLPLGCAVGSGGWLAIPWYFAQDLGDADPFESFVVMGSLAPVFDRPSGNLEDDTPTALLSWELAALDHSRGPSATHQPVVFHDGRKGYMFNEHLRSVIDFRLIIERGEGGDWEIRSFLAGD